MSTEPSIASFLLDFRGDQEVDPLPLVSRAIHAYVLGIISDHNPKLAQYLHGENGSQSFSVSCLRNTKYRTGVLLRIASFNDELSQMFRNLSPQAASNLELAGSTLKLINTIYPEDDNQLTGTTSYHELYNDGVARAREGQAEIGLRFITPTSFRTAGSRLNMPLPWPQLVFQSLANKWNNAVFTPNRLSQLVEIYYVAKARCEHREYADFLWRVRLILESAKEEVYDHLTDQQWKTAKEAHDALSRLVGLTGKVLHPDRGRGIRRVRGISAGWIEQAFGDSVEEVVTTLGALVGFLWKQHRVGEPLPGNPYEEINQHVKEGLKELSGRSRI